MYLLMFQLERSPEPFTLSGLPVSCMLELNDILRAAGRVGEAVERAGVPPAAMPRLITRRAFRHSHAPRGAGWLSSC